MAEQERACRICGCTETTPCTTPDGPCHWVTTSPRALCSACVVVLGVQRRVIRQELQHVQIIVPKMCQCCDLVEMVTFSHGEKAYTCRKKRFDGGTGYPRSYAWSGLTWPNKGVAKAQKHCPFFEVHRRFTGQAP